MAELPRIGSRKAGATASLTLEDLASWIPVDEDALSPERRSLFLRRKQAIRMYVAHASEAELKAATGLTIPVVYKLIAHRCLAQHEDGTLLGWRGALPFFRIHGYERKAGLHITPGSGGAVGALGWLFASESGREIETRFRQQILSRPAGLAGARRSKQELFQWFIKELRSRGYERRGEWPFNVQRLGYVTIGRFIDKVYSEEPVRARQLLGGPQAVRKARAGDGSRRPDLQGFDRVECDAHKLDARMVVMVPSPHGGYEPRTIHRLWVIVIIEVASRAVLGYYLSLHRECGAEDVLRAIKCALSPWSQRKLQFSQHAYVSEAGLPSVRHPRYLGACWNEFSVDGAMANVCARVEQPLREVVGATVLKPQDPASYTSRRSPDDRPFIESFFKHLAQGGFHRLATTTGSSPLDRRGNDPDLAAHATQFQLEYAEELLDTLIANYNATPHSGLGYRSPLAQLDFICSRRDAPIRQADPVQVRRMVGIRRLCTLHGGPRTGRRPHFNFANARYSAEWLCLRPDLVGQAFWLQIEDEDDARWATVSTQQGLFLGAVRAAPPWHLTPHTLFMRQAIRSLDKRRLLYLSSQCDAVEELIRYAEQSADKKLQPHPAYLEARRVLQSHADKLRDEDLVAHPRADGPDGSPGAAAETGSTTEDGQPRRPLPPMQMAKTW
jgi:hypothetical protein